MPFRRKDVQGDGPSCAEGVELYISCTSGLVLTLLPQLHPWPEMEHLYHQAYQ